MGGEKRPLLPWLMLLAGSPPHGRGKEFKNDDIDLEDRITPAWAGKRNSSGRSTQTPRDHPRMGGEKLRLP